MSWYLSPINHWPPHEPWHEAPYRAIAVIQTCHESNPWEADDIHTAGAPQSTPHLTRSQNTTHWKVVTLRVQPRHDWADTIEPWTPQDPHIPTTGQFTCAQSPLGPIAPTTSSQTYSIIGNPMPAKGEITNQPSSTAIVQPVQILSNSWFKGFLSKESQLVAWSQTWQNSPLLRIYCRDNAQSFNLCC